MKPPMHRPDTVYRPRILWTALAGAVIAGAMLGGLALLLAEGVTVVAGLGQLAAGGRAVAAFTAAGLGIALGGLMGALIALYTVPKRKH